MSAEKQIKFRGEVAAWSLGNPEKPRKWTVIKMTYEEFRHWTFVSPYNDKNGRGWQRKQSKDHIRNLGRDMDADNFTPAIFCAGLVPSQSKSLRWFRDGDAEMVEITVTANMKLPCIDGGHRAAALAERLRKAQEANDDTASRFVDGQEISVQVFLDHSNLQTDFMNLQKGKAMDRNQMRSMQSHNRLLDPEKQPIFEVANLVVHALNENPRSHLAGQVQFDSTEKRAIQFNSITTWQGSDLATSIYGGAKIALAFGKNADWLEETYCEAWEALAKPGAKGKIPPLLKPGRMLCPTIYGGKRGPTHFIVAIGNLLAWRKAFLNHESATPEDLKLAVEVAENLLAGESIGWSGDDKRVKAREFASNFLGDLVSDRPEEGKSTTAYQGVPAPLVGILTPGAFKIDKKYLPAPERRTRSKSPAPAPAPTEGVDALDGGIEEEVGTPKRTRRKPVPV